MTWNYRVIKTTVEVLGWEPEESFAIHEVYYFEDGRPRAYTETPVPVTAESMEELAATLDAMRVALTKPVLTHGDFPESDPEFFPDNSKDDPSP